MHRLIQIALALGIAMLVVWLVLVIVLLVAKPKPSVMKGALRLLPDTLLLLKRLATDRSLPRSLRIRLFLLFGYLALPFDIIPDFIPVLGYIDDVILVLVVLRVIVKHAGIDVVRRHWGGTEDGLLALLKAVGVRD